MSKNSILSSFGYCKNENFNSSWK